MVHVVRRDAIAKKADASQKVELTRTDFAKRGAILSADGKPLAQDDDTYVLNVGFREVPQSPAFFTDLSEASGIPAAEFLQLAAAGVSRRVWRNPIRPEQAEAILKVKREWRADGVSLDRTGERSYALGEAASGITGVFREGRPQGGLEARLDETLRGENGQTVGLVDRAGAFLPMRLDRASRSRQDGETLTLTIDSELQSVAATAIRDAVRKNKAENGVAIVMDPATGNLLAMANYPSLDPLATTSEHFDRGRQSDLNPNVMLRLEPGSTFKILTLAKALDAGKFSMGSHLYCSGQLGVGRRFIRCDAHHGTRAHGDVDAVKAISKSCNVAAATWARNVGYEAFTQYLRDLGLLQRPGIGLPGEVRGDFNFEEYNKPLQLANVGFGQSLTVTPVSLASAFSTIANGGVRMQPRLVARVGAKDTPVREAGRVLSAPSADAVMRAMEATIQNEGGTGYALRVPGYRLGGKTGTAQKVNQATGGMQGGGYIANFVGFVPAQKPRAVVLVMVNHPQAGVFYGGQVAGPVFREIAKATIRRLNIPPSE